MRYNVELYITHQRIEQVGKTQAFEWASFEAWYKALQGAKPQRSLLLDRTEIDEHEIGGPHAYKIRFSFLIDAANVAANVAKDTSSALESPKQP